MKSSNKNILNLLAFCALIIVALLMLIDNLLPLVGIEVKGAFFNILRTISNIFTIIILGVSAYKFTADSKKWLGILFWIAVAIFVVATVLMWFIK